MNDIACARIKTEAPSDETESAETTGSDNVENHLQAGLDMPLNCFHSIFGVDPHWEGTAVKIEPELKAHDPHSAKWEEFNLDHKITISNLKNEHPGFRIEYEKSCTTTDFVFKPEQFFDKSSARDRLKCPQCYFLTDNRGNLKQHMKIHQKPQGRTLYHCEFCDFKTKYKNSIKGHVLRHEKMKVKKGRKKQKRSKKI